MQTFKSAATSQKQLARGFKLMARRDVFVEGCTNLDIGGGKYDIGTRFLKLYGVENLILDQYNQTEPELNVTLSKLLKRDADTGTCFNVLNVIREYEIRRMVLETLKASVKKDGLIFISAYHGNRSGIGKPSKRKDSWQENRVLFSYLGEVASVFPTAKIANGLILAINS